MSILNKCIVYHLCASHVSFVLSVFVLVGGRGENESGGRSAAVGLQ